MTPKAIRDAREAMNIYTSPSYRLGRALGMGIPVPGECPVCKKPMMVRPPSHNPHFVIYQGPCAACLEWAGARMRLA